MAGREVVKNDRLLRDVVHEIQLQQKLAPDNDNVFGMPQEIHYKPCDAG